MTMPVTPPDRAALRAELAMVSLRLRVAVRYAAKRGYAAPYAVEACERLATLAAELLDRVCELERCITLQNDEIEQTLGRALGYPRYADDQKNFPGATDADGVCVGEHVAETLAMEAAREIARLRADLHEKPLPDGHRG